MAESLLLLRQRWRPDIALLVGALTLCAVIFSLNAMSLKNLKEDTLRSVEANMKSQAIALAEEGNRSFEALESVLAAVSDHVAQLAMSDDEAAQRQLGSRELHELLKERTSRLSHVGAIGLVNSQGQLLNLSNSWPMNDVNLSDRDYFKALKGDARLRVFVGQPVQNRFNGSWAIVLARRINASNGDFLGLAFGGITLAHFERFFESIAWQEGAAFALVRHDGMLLARYPRSDQPGKIVAFAERMVRAKRVTARHIQSPVDGQIRIVSARPLASYPLILAVSQTEESALRSWRILADHSTSMAYFRTIFVLFVAWAACRWWKRQRSLTEQLRIQNLRFDTALDNMGTGLCMFDADKRLAVCNDRYAELYKLPAELLQPGTPHSAIITHRVRHGILEGDTNENAVQRKLSELRGLSDDTASSRVDRFADGRLIRVTRQPMAGGGWVATHEDVTERE